MADNWKPYAPKEPWYKTWFKEKKNWLWIALGLGIVALVLLLIFLWSGASKSKVETLDPEKIEYTSAIFKGTINLSESEINGMANFVYYENGNGNTVETPWVNAAKEFSAVSNPAVPLKPGISYKVYAQYKPLNLDATQAKLLKDPTPVEFTTKKISVTTESAEKISSGLYRLKGTGNASDPLITYGFMYKSDEATTWTPSPGVPSNDFSYSVSKPPKERYIYKAVAYVGGELIAEGKIESIEPEGEPKDPYEGLEVTTNKPSETDITYYDANVSGKLSGYNPKDFPEGVKPMYSFKWKNSNNYYYNGSTDYKEIASSDWSFSDKITDFASGEEIKLQAMVKIGDKIIPGNEVAFRLKEMPESEPEPEPTPEPTPEPEPVPEPENPTDQKKLAVDAVSGQAVQGDNLTLSISLIGYLRDMFGHEAVTCYFKLWSDLIASGPGSKSDPWLIGGIIMKAPGSFSASTLNERDKYGRAIIIQPQQTYHWLAAAKDGTDENSSYPSRDIITPQLLP